MQSALMVLKILAIALLVFAGAFLVRGHITWKPVLDQPVSPGLLLVLWRGHGPRGFCLWRVAYRDLRFGGNERPAPRPSPRPDDRRHRRGAVLHVSELRMRARAWCRNPGTHSHAGFRRDAHGHGEKGATMIALGIAISTLGFLSQSVLTAPRVYFAMARDGLFFRQLAWVHPRTQPCACHCHTKRVDNGDPVHRQLRQNPQLRDFHGRLFWALTAGCLFVLRRRAPARSAFSMPGHPYTTALFCLVCLRRRGQYVYTVPGKHAHRLRYSGGRRSHVLHLESGPPPHDIFQKHCATLLIWSGPNSSPLQNSISPPAALPAFLCRSWA